MSLQTYGRWLCLAVLSVLLAPCVIAQKPVEAAAVKDFQDGITNYIAAKKKQDLPNKPTGSPDKLAQQKQETIEKTQAIRAGARRGDIFTPSVSAYFKKQIKATLHGPEGDKVRASLRHAEPLPNVQLVVNTKYPKNLPLQSTPPTLLLHLPSLPKELQYRIVGSTLVLYDMSSDLVVDFIPNAVPGA